jgi:hypothetical protein
VCLSDHEHLLRFIVGSSFTVTSDSEKISNRLDGIESTPIQNLKKQGPSVLACIIQNNQCIDFGKLQLARRRVERADQRDGSLQQASIRSLGPATVFVGGCLQSWRRRGRQHRPVGERQ